MDIIIRKSTVSDAEEILRLYQEYCEFYEIKSDKRDHLLKEFRAYAEDISVGAQFIALDGDVVVAFATLAVSYSAIRMGELIVLKELFICPDYRGKNIGKQLFKACQQYSIDNNYHDMLWMTNTEEYALKTLYDKFGGSEREDDFYNI
ncbi:MAG: GNAT family N-acetyltransferase [Candidatus Heimdallarchaeota archaeon]|nr:GNAT family N-acetyltransferase [Candidatus Heimdallarchaeota archaeon]